MARRDKGKDRNTFNSVSPVRFPVDAAGNAKGWSQTMRKVLPEKSPHWDERKGGGFKRDDVFPCNEGFPGLTRIGPVDTGWPVMFDVVLASGRKSRGMVSPKEIDGLPSWLLADDQRRSTVETSYCEVAGWATPTRDYDWFERAVLWLIRITPIR